MLRADSLRGCGAVALLAFWLATAAHAANVVPPRALDETPLAFPTGAIVDDDDTHGVERFVVLRLSIDATGAVTAAEVATSGGSAFDEAALAAAKTWTFAPALRDGVPLASRVLYRVAFAPPPAPVVDTPRSDRVSDELSDELPAPIEVTVRARDEGVALRRSSEAVTVLDVEEARAASADLGELLARTQGVSVRRGGGLGSATRFSLNGLSDDQVRFFLDGVPLEAAGYPFGIANVPVNLVERVEVFRGVVPLRLGADALGGAVNLVSPHAPHTGAGASIEVGSFATRRLTLAGNLFDAGTGLYARADGFFDTAENNYLIDVEVPDEVGRLSPARVRRFHDGYLAYGGSLEAGIVDVPWARRLSLRAFGARDDKELPHNVSMTVPYGEARFADTLAGGTLRYDVDVLPALRLETLASYSHHATDFVDDSAFVYDWLGNRVRERRVKGEIEGTPSNQTLWVHHVVGRAGAVWQLHDDHALRFTWAPAFATRTGDERLQLDPNVRDPLTARRDLFTSVVGVEHQMQALRRVSPTERALATTFFAKGYALQALSEEVLPGNIFRPLDRSAFHLGAGGTARLFVTELLLVKASYEYATRLPRPDEIFGNGVLIQPNLDLIPEVSHNANLGARLELERLGDVDIGDLMVDVGAFWRETDKLIVLLGNDRLFMYQNVFGARSVGVESAASYTAFDLVTVDGGLTLQDFRNVSTEGTFGSFAGDRIPNRPWLFGSWGARVRLVDVARKGDALEPFYAGRFVGGFFRGWESQGLRAFKQSVPDQIVHSAGVTYSLHAPFGGASLSVEVHNLADQPTFDFFGVQRPGRSLHVKLTGDLG